MAINVNTSTSTQSVAPQPTVNSKPAPEYTDVTAAESGLKTESTTKVSDNVSDKSSESYSEHTPSNDQIKQAVENINKSMSDCEAVYGIHDETNRVTIKIVDKKTKEVIKELPPEKTLDMIARVWEMAGLLVDEKR